MAQYLDFSISKKRAKGILDGEEDVKEEEQVQPEEPEEEVKQEELKDKITTVQKSMNFLEKAYSIQNMLMNILKETKQDQHDISSSLEAFQESTNEVGVQVGTQVQEEDVQSEEQSSPNDQKE